MAETAEIGTRVASIGRSSVVLAQVLYMKERCVVVGLYRSADGHDDASIGTPPRGDGRALRVMAWPNSGGVPTTATSVNVLHR